MSIEDNSGDEEQFTTIQEVPVNDEFIQALREAGASEFLIRFIQVKPDEVGVSRNSVRQEVQKYCYWDDEISAEAIRGKRNYGGHFFQAVWDGDTKEARVRADGNNQKILDKLNVA